MRILELGIKLAALAIAAGFLYLHWERRNIGRYQTEPNTQNITVLDTATGITYVCYTEGCKSFDPRNKLPKTVE
jgi:hypothetical protein